MHSFLKTAAQILLLMFFIALQPLYSLQEPSIKDPEVPDEPVVDDSLMTDIHINDSFKANKTSYLFLVKAMVTLAGGSEESGMLYVSNTLRLTMTNRVKNTLSIRSISLYDIAKIEIIRWEAREKGDNNYLFVPVQYKIYTNLNSAGFFEYKGNIDIFNTFLFGSDDQKIPLATVFYDTWVEGKKNSFHWENTKSPVFGYNFMNPVDGIVTAIRFDKRY